MKTVTIADVTLRACGQDSAGAPGFKEKLGIARALDRIAVDEIETAPLSGDKADELFLHTLAPLVPNRTVICPVAPDASAVKAAREALRPVSRARLDVQVPVSAVQMEYLCRKKPPMVLEALSASVKLARELGIDAEVSLLDATRAERDFLVAAVKAAVEAGACGVTLCDSAGAFLASEMHSFVSGLVADVPELSKVVLCVECSDALHMAGACAIACLSAGASRIKVASCRCGALPLRDFADILRLKGRELGLSCALDLTACETFAERIAGMAGGQPAAAAAQPAAALPGTGSEDWKISASDDEAAVAAAVRKLGYELSPEDSAKVFQEVKRIAAKKDVAAKDLDAIVAAAALQVPPTYALESFVINCGNLIASMANVTLVKDGEPLQGFSMGDGPIDAAFRSIENILGRHFELDDFSLASVTEGREAVGSAVVRLLADGKLYSGKGISTDVVGAAIRAYVNALNKICHEENRLS